MCVRAALSLMLLLITSAVDGRQPLEPLDTSNPRATFESFFILAEETIQRYAEYRDSPSPASQQALWQQLAEAERLFDLSEVPPVVQRKTANRAFYLLWEIFARLELPRLEEIPDASAYTNDDDKAEQPARWRVPDTEITIARIEEGTRAGEFLFSADTVSRVEDFYEASRVMPYLRSTGIEDVERINQLLTGWMIPMRWVEALPDWANRAMFGQVLWKWLALLLLFGLALTAMIGVFRWERRKVWDSAILSYLSDLSVPLVILVLANFLWFFAVHQINVTGAAAELPDYFEKLANGLAVVWIVWVTVQWIAERIISAPQISARSLYASFIRLIARSIGVVAVLVFIFSRLHDLGVPVYGLVAGAGVGGLSVALAARSTLENFIGALNLFADRPVQVGDLCRYDEDSALGWRPVGRVESIGLRSTAIRRQDRALVTIPNAEFSQKHIVNLSACDRFLLKTTLGLRYETTDDQLRFVLAELRELFQAHPKTIHTTADPLRVRFIGFGDHSLNVLIRVYVSTNNYNEFLAIQEDIFLRAMKIVKQAGTGFAFPSRTLYHTRDGGLDEERQQAAEKQVREWGSEHKLPFPDFTEAYRKQIEDTLDYPPEGSPKADSG